MQDSKIIVDDRPYDILFTFRSPDQNLFLLLSDGSQTFAVRYEESDSGEPELFPVTDRQIERIVSAYNQAVEDTFFHEGKTWRRQTEAAGFILAATDEDPLTYVPFSPETREPVILDEAALAFVTDSLRTRLNSDREVLLNAQPGIDDPERIAGQAICELEDGISVYLDFRLDQKGQLIFVENGRPVVRHDRQKELHRRFLDWEQDQFAQAASVRVQNIHS